MSTQNLYEVTIHLSNLFLLDLKPFTYLNLLVPSGELFEVLKPYLYYSEVQLNLDKSLLISYGRASFNEGEIVEGERSYKCFINAFHKVINLNII
jgi:hypothetical protein